LALNLSDRTCTGVLASHPLSRDIHVRQDPIPFSFCWYSSIDTFVLACSLSLRLVPPPVARSVSWFT
jgi:hypothetical protein